MRDYYSILRVPRDANLEVLKRAYRMRAVECHPDRGGSHEQMILVNEAWLILANPTTRKNFDSFQTNRNNETAQQTAQKDAEYSHKKANEYPRKWDEFDKWFSANYGSTDLALGCKIPTGGDSVGRWLFILGGGFLGLLFSTSIVQEANGHGAAGIVILLVAGGAWLGVFVHYLFTSGNKVKGSSEESFSDFREEKLDTNYDIYTDPQTSLMWARNGNIAGEFMTWDKAMKWVAGLKYGGYSDWRLPTKDELKAFANQGGKRPSYWFSLNGFNDVQSSWYWSATADCTKYAGCVDMLDGITYTRDKTYDYYVWPVRCGQ